MAKCHWCRKIITSKSFHFIYKVDGVEIELLLCKSCKQEYKKMYDILKKEKGLKDQIKKTQK